MKKKIFLLAFIFIFAIIFYAANVRANGEDEYCLNLNVDYENGFTSSNVKSIKVNGTTWTSGTDVFNATVTDHKLWTIVFVTTKNGDEYPFVSTAGGLVIDDENDPNYPGYGSYSAIPNPDNPDEFIITVTLNDSWGSKGDPAADPKVCGGYGVTITSGPPIETPAEEVTSDVYITIKGEELEYHYDAEHLDEADVAYFKFDINGGTEENHLVPFTFRNAEYTYIDGKEPPKNVSQVTTKAAIPYKYEYNGKGTVEFCVNGGGTDEYTSIKINDTEYSQYAPHTKEEYWQTLEGWAQKFCIPNVPYNTEYRVVVEGRQTDDENKIPGFGWSYLSATRSEGLKEEEEGNFAHGRLVFASASLEIDGEVKSFSSANLFNNYRYKGKGQIFQWGEGNKEYPEENRRLAWGEAQMPWGTTISVRIVPDEGYQLTGLTVSENGFQATDEPGVYTLTLNRTNLSYNEDQNQFNLNPKFEKVGATGITESEAVSNVTITVKDNNSFTNGTPKLSITDANVSNDQRDAFSEKAGEQGYAVSNIVDISLYSSIYKGGKKDNNNNYLSWDTEVNNLNSKASIGLELNDSLAGKEVALVHELHDDKGVTGYEFVEGTYDSSTNTMNFEESNFSNFAIVVRDANETPDENEKIKVDFDTRAPKGMDPVEIPKGSTVTKPADPTDEGRVFLGWFSDENFENEFDFNTKLYKDTVLYAKWRDAGEHYVVKDESGNSIEFDEVKDRKYTFTFVDILKMTDEELKSLNATREQFNQVKDIMIKVTDKYGTMLAVYQVLVTDKEDGHELHDGPFKVKIKITEEMKKYNEFVLIYFDDEFKNEDPITLKVEGDYLVGTLPHLSPYALVGDTKLPDNPKTGDNINTWIIVAIISIIGLSVSTLYITKKAKVRIK